MSTFHPTSFALGFGSAVFLFKAGSRLRPVVVELSAVGVHFGRLGLALLERQREHIEDLWAEIDDLARRKATVRALRPGAQLS
jgi:hypothetical protein